MLTPLTQTAIVVLNDIACGELSARSSQYVLFPQTMSQLLVSLESHGLIRLLPGRPREAIFSYQLSRSTKDITLLDVLEATGEHLNCNHEACEDMYHQYGAAARKLGVVNRITRQYLSEIKLTDL